MSQSYTNSYVFHAFVSFTVLLSQINVLSRMVYQNVFDRFHSLPFNFSIKKSNIIDKDTVCVCYNANHELYYLHQILSMFFFPHGHFYGADKYNPDFIFQLSQMLQWTEIYMLHSYNVVFLVLTYAIPMLIMIVCYTIMGRVLWGSQSIGEHTQRQIESIKSKKKVCTRCNCSVTHAHTRKHKQPLTHLTNHSLLLSKSIHFPLALMKNTNHPDDRCYRDSGEIKGQLGGGRKERGSSWRKE